MSDHVQMGPGMCHDILPGPPKRAAENVAAGAGGAANPGGFGGLRGYPRTTKDDVATHP